LFTILLASCAGNLPSKTVESPQPAKQVEVNVLQEKPKVELKSMPTILIPPNWTYVTDAPTLVSGFETLLVAHSPQAIGNKPVGIVMAAIEWKGKEGLRAQEFSQAVVHAIKQAGNNIFRVEWVAIQHQVGTFIAYENVLGNVVFQINVVHDEVGYATMCMGDAREFAKVANVCEPVMNTFNIGDKSTKPTQRTRKMLTASR
jgi:hypothetical protein